MAVGRICGGSAALQDPEIPFRIRKNAAGVRCFGQGLCYHEVINEGGRIE